MILGLFCNSFTSFSYFIVESDSDSYLYENINPVLAPTELAVKLNPDLHEILIMSNEKFKAKIL